MFLYIFIFLLIATTITLSIILAENNSSTCPSKTSPATNVYKMNNSIDDLCNNCLSQCNESPDVCNMLCKNVCPCSRINPSFYMFCKKNPNNPACKQCVN